MFSKNGSKARLARACPSPKRSNTPSSQGSVSGSAAATALIDSKYDTRITCMWLAAWLVNNIGITMLNKFAFSVGGFDFPLVTSAFHMICNWLGTAVYFWTTGMERKPVKRGKWGALLAFSVVFSLNIGIGNISQSLVPVSFNQVMRSLVPAIVMVMGIQMFGKNFSRARKLAVLPVVVGVALACYGEMTDSLKGFAVTVLCIVLAAFKVVLSGEMLTGEMKMPPINLLSYMTPLALVQLVVMAVAFGEVSKLVNSWSELKGSLVLYVVGITGIGSFSLNLCSLQANKVTSPLTLSIMANVKQVLLIAGSSLFLPEVHKTWLNIVGFVVVILASTRYSVLSIAERNREIREEDQPVETGTKPLLPK